MLKVTSSVTNKGDDIVRVDDAGSVTHVYLSVNYIRRPSPRPGHIDRPPALRPAGDYTAMLQCDDLDAGVYRRYIIIMVA